MHRPPRAAQALLLLNEREYLKAARHLTARLLPKHGTEPAELVDALYETITSRAPTAKEREAVLKLVADLEGRYVESPELADKLCAGVTLAAGVKPPQLAAWTMLTSTMYNLDITKTRQ